MARGSNDDAEPLVPTAARCRRVVTRSAREAERHSVEIAVQEALGGGDHGRPKIVGGLAAAGVEAQHEAVSERERSIWTGSGSSYPASFGSPPSATCPSPMLTTPL